MRCPRCGHSFVVAPQAADSAAAAPPRVPSPRVAQPTMSGVAPPPPRVAPPSPPRPSKPSPLPSRTPRTPLPSDFPAALGSLDESNLPVVAPALPEHKPSPPKAPRPPPPGDRRGLPASAGDFALDFRRRSSPTFRLRGPKRRRLRRLRRPRSISILPSALSDLPEARLSDLPAARAASRKTEGAAAGDDPDGGEESNLPSVLADLPAPTVGLPSVAVSLPSVAASLAEAPIPPGSLRPPARSFGEINLPTVSERAIPSTGDRPSLSIPPLSVVARPPPTADSVTGDTVAATPSDGLAGDPMGAFGELELPREDVSPPPVTALTRRTDSNDFGDLELDEKPRPSKASLRALAPSPAAAPAHPETTRAGGGMSFGEVQFGDAEPSPPTIRPLPAKSKKGLRSRLLGPRRRRQPNRWQRTRSSRRLRRRRGSSGPGLRPSGGKRPSADASPCFLWCRRCSAALRSSSRRTVPSATSR